MRTLKAGEFKAKCLKLMDSVAESGEEILITKNGKPVARLVPVGSRPRELFGALADTMELRDSLIDPVDESWDAEIS